MARIHILARSNPRESKSSANSSSGIFTEEIENSGSDSEGSSSSVDSYNIDNIYGGANDELNIEEIDINDQDIEK